jgi:hypothetical protein
LYKKIYVYYCIDYCWPSIHSILKILNNETIYEYNDRIYYLAHGKIEAARDDKVLLISCVSHTSHRFSEALKKYKIFTDIDHRHFANKCFSLMLNCKELNEIKQIFRWICNCFLRQSNDKICQNARQSLQNIIQSRNYEDISNQQKDLYSRKPENEEVIDEEIKLPKSKKTIKSESKFGLEFHKIYEEAVQISLGQYNKTTNTSISSKGV